MEQIKVKVYVNSSAAVRAGKTMSGEALVAVTEESLAALTEAERTALADAIGHSTMANVRELGNEADDGIISEPTWEQALASLRHRMTVRAERTARKAIERDLAIREEIENVVAGGVEKLIFERFNDSMALWELVNIGCAHYGTGSEEARQVQNDPHVAALLAEARLRVDEHNAKVKQYRAEQEAARKAAAAAKLAAEREAAVRFKSACATFCAARPELAGRYSEGLLSEAEMLSAIRDEAFAGLNAFPRYERLIAADLRGCNCYDDEGCPCGEPKAGFYVSDDVPSLSQGGYETLLAIRAAAGDGAKVEPRSHRVYCARCDEAGEPDGEAARLSVRVTIDWHGRKLSREYAL